MVHFFGVFFVGFVFPFFVFEGGEWGGTGQRWTYSIMSNLKASKSFEITFKLDLHLGS